MQHRCNTSRCWVKKHVSCVNSLYRYCTESPDCSDAKERWMRLSGTARSFLESDTVADKEVRAVLQQT